jgi:hypothetical protein
LNGTREENLTLSADNLRVVKWYVDASFAVHPDDTGKRRNAINCEKTEDEHEKQHGRQTGRKKDDAATMILWTKLFLEAQGYDVKKNIVYQ